MKQKQNLGSRSQSCSEVMDTKAPNRAEVRVNSNLSTAQEPEKPNLVTRNRDYSDLKGYHHWGLNE